MTPERLASLQALLDQAQRLHGAGAVAVARVLLHGAMQSLDDEERQAAGSMLLAAQARLAPDDDALMPADRLSLLRLVAEAQALLEGGLPHVAQVGFDVARQLVAAGVEGVDPSVLEAGLRACAQALQSGPRRPPPDDDEPDMYAMLQAAEQARQEGRHESALRLLAPLRAVCEALLERDPSSGPVRDMLAQVLESTGANLASMGRPRDAAEPLARAQALFDALQAEEPDRLDYELKCATVRVNRAVQSKGLGDLAQAEVLHAQAWQRFQDLSRRDPGRADLRRHAALSSMNRANNLELLGRLAEADELHDIAGRELDALVAIDPSPLHQASAARSCMNRGQCRAAMADPEGAEHWYGEAQQRFDALCRQHPGNRRMMSDAALVRGKRASSLRSRGQLDAAQHIFAEAVALHDRLQPGYEGDDETFRYRIEGRKQRALCFEALGREPDAESCYGEVLALLESRLEHAPDDAELCRDHARTAALLAACRMRQGRHDEALATVQAAVPRLDPARPGDAGSYELLLSAVVAPLIEAHRFAAVEPLLAQVMTWLQAALRQERDAAATRRLLIRAGAQWADTLLELGRHTKALEAAEDAWEHLVALRTAVEGDAAAELDSWSLRIAVTLAAVLREFERHDRAADLLEGAAHNLRARLRSSPDDHDLRNSLAAVLVNLASSLNMLGQNQASEVAADEAGKHFLELMEAKPEQPGLALEAAVAAMNRANNLRVIRRHESAERLYLEAAAMIAQDNTPAGDDRRCSIELNRARNFTRWPRPDDAEHCLRKAHELAARGGWEQAAHQHADATLELGQLLLTRGDEEAAGLLLDAAQAGFDALHRAHPQKPSLRVRCAAPWLARACTARDAGDIAAAERGFTAALQCLHGDAVAEAAGWLAYHRAQIQVELAAVLGRQGRHGEAEAVCREALVTLDACHAAAPGDAAVLRATAQAQGQLARELHQQREFEAAEVAFAEAQRLRLRLCDDDGLDLAGRHQLATLLMDYAINLRALGRPVEATAHSRSACALLAELVESRPDDPSLAADAALALGNLAQLARQEGNLNHADTLLAEAERWCERAGAAPGSINDHWLLVLSTRANVASQSGRANEADHLHARVLAHLERLPLAVREEPHNQYNEYLGRLNRAAHFAKSDRHAEADAALRELIPAAEALAAAEDWVGNWLQLAIDSRLCALNNLVLAGQSRDAAMHLPRVLELLALGAADLHDVTVHRFTLTGLSVAQLSADGALEDAAARAAWRDLCRWSMDWLDVVGVAGMPPAVRAGGSRKSASWCNEAATPPPHSCRLPSTGACSAKTRLATTCCLRC
jgi:hypothetical protein